MFEFDLNKNASIKVEDSHKINYEYVNLFSFNLVKNP